MTCATAPPCGSRGLHHYLDPAPLSLTEPHDAQPAARDVAQEDGGPDVGGAQAARRLEQGAETERHHDLRHDRDVQRRAGVARALESPGVRESHGDEEPRDTEEAE